MFSAAKYYFGQITVTQTDKNIVVDGINSKDLIDQIIATERRSSGTQTARFLTIESNQIRVSQACTT